MSYWFHCFFDSEGVLCDHCFTDLLLAAQGFEPTIKFTCQSCRHYAGVNCWNLPLPLFRKIWLLILQCYIKSSPAFEHFPEKFCIFLMYFIILSTARVHNSNLIVGLKLYLNIKFAFPHSKHVFIKQTKPNVYNYLPCEPNKMPPRAVYLPCCSPETGFKTILHIRARVQHETVKQLYFLIAIF